MKMPAEVATSAGIFIVLAVISKTYMLAQLFIEHKQE
jgi:hypothetical protein